MDPHILTIPEVLIFLEEHYRSSPEHDLLAFMANGKTYIFQSLDSAGQWIKKEIRENDKLHLSNNTLKVFNEHKLELYVKFQDKSIAEKVYQKYQEINKFDFEEPIILDLSSTLYLLKDKYAKNGISSVMNGKYYIFQNSSSLLNFLDGLGINKMVLDNDILHLVSKNKIQSMYFAKTSPANSIYQLWSNRSLPD